MKTIVYKISLRIYLIILGLAIPFYLLLYGASGHEFNPPIEDILWIMMFVFALTIITVYVKAETKKGVTYNFLKAMVAASLIGTFYYGLKAFISIVGFTYGDDVSIIIIGFSYALPLAFMASIVVLFMGLLRNDLSSEQRDNTN